MQNGLWQSEKHRWNGHGGDVWHDAGSWRIVRGSEYAWRDEVSSENSVKPGREDVELVSGTSTGIFLSNFRTNEFWPVLNSLHRSAILIAGRCEGKAFAVYIAIPKKIQNRLYIYSSVHFISFMYFIYLVPHKKHRFTPFDREKLIWGYVEERSIWGTNCNILSRELSCVVLRTILV